MKSLLIALSTLGPVGYLPASGTVASIITAPLVYYVFNAYSQPISQLIIVVILSVLAIYLIQCALESFQRWDDPHEIVIDEFVGMFVTFIGVNLTPLSVVVGLFFFRVLDIFKPFGIHRLEYVGGSVGILLDDLAAGLGACIAMHLLYWFLL